MKYKKRSSQKKKQRQRHRFSKKYAIIDQHGGGLMDQIALIKGQGGIASSMAVHPTQPLIAVGDDAGGLALWTIDTYSKQAQPKKLAQLVGLPISVVKCIEFHSTLPFIAAACSGVVLLWRFDQIRGDVDQEQKLEPSHTVCGWRDKSLEKILSEEDAKYKAAEKDYSLEQQEQQVKKLSQVLDSMMREKNRLSSILDREIKAREREAIQGSTKKLTDDEFKGVSSNLTQLEKDIEQEEQKYQTMKTLFENVERLKYEVERLKYEGELIKAENEVSCIAFHPNQPYIAVGQNNKNPLLTNKVAICRFRTDGPPESEVIYDVILMRMGVVDYNQINILMVSFNRDGNMLAVITDSEQNNLILEAFNGDIQPIKEESGPLVPMFASVLWAKENTMRMGNDVLEPSLWFNKYKRKLNMYIYSSQSLSGKCTCIAPFTSISTKPFNRNVILFNPLTRDVYKDAINQFRTKMRDGTLTDQEKIKFQHLFFASAQSGFTQDEEEAIRREVAEKLILVITPESIENISKVTRIDEISERGKLTGKLTLTLSPSSQMDVLHAMMRQQGAASADIKIREAYVHRLFNLLDEANGLLLNYDKMKLYELVTASLQSGILNDPENTLNMRYLQNRAQRIVPEIEKECDFIGGYDNGLLKKITVNYKENINPLSKKIEMGRMIATPFRNKINEWNGGGAIECLAVHPSLPLLASSSRNAAKLWSFETHEEIAIPLQAHARSLVGLNEIFLAVLDGNGVRIHSCSPKDYKELRNEEQFFGFGIDLKLANRQGDSCSICGEPLNNPVTQSILRGPEIPEGHKELQLDCGHTFHKDCIEPWLKKGTCPLCRAVAPVAQATPQPIVSKRQQRQLALKEENAKSVGETIQDRHIRLQSLQSARRALQGRLVFGDDVPALPEVPESVVEPEAVAPAPERQRKENSENGGGKRKKKYSRKKNGLKNHKYYSISKQYKKY